MTYNRQINTSKGRMSFNAPNQTVKNLQNPCKSNFPIFVAGTTTCTSSCHREYLRLYKGHKKMQNKPNFHNHPGNPIPCKQKTYQQRPTMTLRKNEPNSNPIVEKTQLRWIKIITAFLARTYHPIRLQHQFQPNCQISTKIHVFLGIQPLYCIYYWALDSG